MRNDAPHVPHQKLQWWLQLAREEAEGIRKIAPPKAGERTLSYPCLGVLFATLVPYLEVEYGLIAKAIDSYLT